MKKKHMYVYCIDICIIFMEFCFAFNGHGLWFHCYASARYSFCKHFQVNMEEKISINVWNNCWLYLLRTWLIWVSGLMFWKYCNAENISSHFIFQYNLKIVFCNNVLKEHFDILGNMCILLVLSCSELNIKIYTTHICSINIGNAGKNLAWFCPKVTNLITSTS